MRLDPKVEARIRREQPRREKGHPDSGSGLGCSACDMAAVLDELDAVRAELATEREACATAVEALAGLWHPGSGGEQAIAEAVALIRARGRS